jgi:hypothetical protein
MCPLCVSSLAWLALGGGSASTLAAVLIGLKLKGNGHGDDCDGKCEPAPNRDS